MSLSLTRAESGRGYDISRDNLVVSKAVHMIEAPEPLVGDLLSWLRSEPRPYAEVMDAWRTSCPKLPVWEDALDTGLIERRNDLVFITEAGKEWLAARQR